LAALRAIYPDHADDGKQWFVVRFSLEAVPGRGTKHTSRTESR
jgi:hypothetical protein